MHALPCLSRSLSRQPSNLQICEDCIRGYRLRTATVSAMWSVRSDLWNDPMESVLCNLPPRTLLNFICTTKICPVESLIGILRLGHEGDLPLHETKLLFSDDDTAHAYARAMIWGCSCTLTSEDTQNTFALNLVQLHEQSKNIAMPKYDLFVVGSGKADCTDSQEYRRFSSKLARVTNIDASQGLLYASIPNAGCLVDSRSDRNQTKVGREPFGYRIIITMLYRFRRRKKSLLPKLIRSLHNEADRSSGY